jgi:hypothetical protein
VKKSINLNEKKGKRRSKNSSVFLENVILASHCNHYHDFVIDIHVKEFFHHVLADKGAVHKGRLSCPPSPCEGQKVCMGE